MVVTGKAWSQAPQAPNHRPLWYGTQDPTWAIEVYDANSGTRLARGCPANMLSGSVVIDISQNLVALENYAPPGQSPTTWIVPYTPRPMNPAAWQVGTPVSLGILLSPAWITVDSAGMFWIVGFTSGYMGLWSWTIERLPPHSQVLRFQCNS